MGSPAVTSLPNRGCARRGLSGVAKWRQAEAAAWAPTSAEGGGRHHGEFRSRTSYLAVHLFEPWNSDPGRGVEVLWRRSRSSAPSRLMSSSGSLIGATELRRRSTSNQRSANCSSGLSGSRQQHASGNARGSGFRAGHADRPAASKRHGRIRRRSRSNRWHNCTSSVKACIQFR